MPDLITHISFNYLIYQFVRKYFYLTLFLFGAVAVDILVGLQMFLIDGLKMKQGEEIFTLNAFSHSIFGGFMVALIIGNLFYQRRKAIASIFMGYLLHLLLDFLQTNWGKGNLIFYPFSFQTYTLDLFTYGVDYRYIFVIIPFIIFLFVIFKEKEILPIAVSKKNIIISSVCLIITVMVFFSVFQKTLYSDFFYLNFRFHPKEYDGKVIKMNSVKINSINPVRVKFRRHQLLLNNVDKPINIKYRYRIEGVYHYKEKRLDVIQMYSYYPYAKMMISGLGILMLLLFILLKVRIEIKKP